MPLNDKWLKSGSPSVVSAGTEASGAPFQDQTAEEITPQRMRNFSYEVNQELGKSVLRDPPKVAGAYVGNVVQPPDPTQGQNGQPWLRMTTPYSAGDTNPDALQVYSINITANEVKTTWFNGNGELRSAPSLRNRIAFRCFEHHEVGGTSTGRFFEVSTNPTNTANREAMLGVYGNGHSTMPGWTVATRCPGWTDGRGRRRQLQRVDPVQYAWPEDRSWCAHFRHLGSRRRGSRQRGSFPCLFGERHSRYLGERAMTFFAPVLVGGYTPLSYARILLDDLSNSIVPLPDERYAQLGGQVVVCESLIIGTTGITSQEMLGPQCDVVQVASYDITLARDCANVSNDDGSNNGPAIVAVSDQIDADADALWRWAQGLEYYVTKTFDITWVITGGIAITTMTISLGIP